MRGGRSRDRQGISEAKCERLRSEAGTERATASRLRARGKSFLVIIQHERGLRKEASERQTFILRKKETERGRAQSRTEKAEKQRAV